MSGQEGPIPYPATYEVEYVPMRSLDLDTARCAFHSNDCTESMIGAGGLDVHHGWPSFMGNPAEDGDTHACPNHHRRQHSLLRYLVECDRDGVAPAWAVRRRFTPVERATAEQAVAKWVGIGRPAIRYWNVPAARDA